MSALKEYTVHIAGIPHTVLLSDEDAKRRGVFRTEEKDSDETSRKRVTK